MCVPPHLPHQHLLMNSPASTTHQLIETVNADLSDLHVYFSATSFTHEGHVTGI